MSLNRRRKILEIATIARLVPAISLAGAVHVSRTLSIGLLVLVVTLDVADGAWARSWSVDTDRRRALDSIVDAMSTHLVFLSFFASEPQLLLLYSPIAATSAACGLMSACNLRRIGVLVIGSAWHKSSSLACALFGLTLVMSDTTSAVFAGIVAIATNVATSTNYLGASASLHTAASPLPRTHRHTIRGGEGFRWLITQSSRASTTAMTRSGIKTS